MAIKFDKSKLAKNLASGSILAPFLDRAFDSFDEAWTFDYTEKDIDDAWHPSGDCTPKVTDLYGSRLEGYTAITAGQPVTRAANEISGSLRKSFMVGHYWHQLIQYVVVTKLEFCKPEAIERVGKCGWGTPIVASHLADKHRWQPYHWVRGSGDIVPLETPKWTGIVDIKTMSSHQFKQGSLPEWAATKYLCQLQIYMDLFEQEQGMILAVNKDAPHDFKEFMYVRDQELIDAIYTKWQFVSECFDDQVTPVEEDNERFALPIK